VDSKHPTKVDEHVGRRVRDRREYLQISQGMLAAKLGITYQQLHKYETGDNRITAGRLFLLATALETNIQHFFEGLQPVSRALRRGVAADAAEFEAPDDVELTDLVVLFRSISEPAGRKAVMALARKLAETPDGSKRRRKSN
jgi:transcriptional regulator with XRE-family HTH domain